MTKLREFLSEKKLVDRWTIILTAMNGMFAGAILMFMIALLGFLG